MDNILNTIPNLKPDGGQLKFRVDNIPCYLSYLSDKELCPDGTIVDIFLEANGDLIGYARDISLTDFNFINLELGRPKGYGVVLWVDATGMMVMWTPYIGDEGYFNHA